MKKITIIIVTLLCLGATGFWVYKKFFPSDELLIQQMLADLADTASVAPSSKPLSQLAAAGELAEFFTENVLIEVRMPGGGSRTIKGREELKRILMGLRTSGGRLHVKFEDALVTLSETSGEASVELTAVARTPGTAEGGAPFVQILEMELRKEGDWKVAKTRNVESLRSIN